MSAAKLCLLAVIALCSTSYSEGASLPKDSEENVIISVLHDIADDDEKVQLDLLRYHLFEGYLLKQKEMNIDFPQKRLTDDDTKTLYEHYKSKHWINDENKIKLYSGVVCFPEGCIDLGDPGITP